MPSQKPVVIVDNVYDRINIYPQALLTSSATLLGREAQYAVDYRRERTYFQIAAAAANQAILSDLGAGNTAVVDSCWLDRGHNLWGKTVEIIGSNDAYATSNGSFAAAVPAFGTVGGDPTTGWCVTEEGAIYTLFAAFPTNRYFRVRVTDAWQYILTGLILGKRVQLLGFSNVVDEDSGDRNVRSESSLIPGYSGDDRSYSARMVELKLSQIGATEYDSSIRNLRRLLFDVNQPAVVCMNYGTYPERTWLYKYQGNRWNSPLTRVHRSVSIPLYEHGPLIR